MNTVLQQEITRYNKLLAEIKRSLSEIRKALVGQLVMTETLDSMGTNMFNQLVPENWSKKAYPSLMPLASWTNDLLRRLDFLNKWIENGIPITFWVSGFFFPQAFLTGALQNFARKYQKSIDTISFETVVMKLKDESEVSAKPEDGCIIFGLFMEGARWNAEKHSVDESRPKELFTAMVPIHLLPVQNRSVPDKLTGGIYEIPIYKILTRAGVLSTTGHSTNFVTALEVPS